MTQPVQFLQLVWATLLGMAVFGEPLDAFVLVGGGIIVASATYISHREAVLARRVSARPPRLPQSCSARAQPVAEPCSRSPFSWAQPFSWKVFGFWKNPRTTQPSGALAICRLPAGRQTKLPAVQVPCSSTSAPSST